MLVTLGLQTWVVGLMIALFLFVCVLLVLTVLIQRPQGGGLSGAFGSNSGSGQTAFGAKTGDALTIATIGMFIIYVLAAVGLNFAVRPPSAVTAAPTVSSTTPADGSAAPATTPEGTVEAPAAAVEGAPATGATPADAPPTTPGSTTPPAPVSPEPANTPAGGGTPPSEPAPAPAPAGEPTPTTPAPNPPSPTPTAPPGGGF